MKTIFTKEQIVNQYSPLTYFKYKPHSSSVNSNFKKFYQTTRVMISLKDSGIIFKGYGLVLRKLLDYFNALISQKVESSHIQYGK